MKKCFKLIILFILINIVLYGCKASEPKSQTDVMYAYTGDEITIKFPEYIKQDYDVSITNEEIAYYNNGVLFCLNEGETTVVFTSEKNTYTLNIEINNKDTVEDDINTIIRYIRENMIFDPDNGLNLITSMEGYEFNVSYKSLSPEILDVNGSYVRSLQNKNVTFEATLEYKGINKEFSLIITVPMIPEEEQTTTIEEFINSQIKDVIKNETGILPTYFELYDLNFKWRSSFPGIIDSNNNIFPAYVATKISLYAIYKIGNEEKQMKIEYTSKGISESEKDAYIDRVLNDLIPQYATKQLRLIYGEKLDIIQDYIYPDDVNQLRPGTGKNGTKMPGGPQYVVIHDTGMTGEGDNADGLNEYIHEQAGSPEGRVASWHFSIDDTKVYQHIPTDEIAWHAGDGSSPFGIPNNIGIGGGNQNGIAIETCINPGNDYALTLKRTAKLTATLLIQYGLQLDRIKQHYDFSGKNCPQVIRNSGWMWDEFLKDVEIEYFLMLVGDDIKADWTIGDNSLVQESGLINQPINDKQVELTLNISIDGQTRKYNYKTTVLGLTDQEKIDKVYLDIYFSKMVFNVTSNIELPTYYEDYNIYVTWESSNPEILDSNGKYNKPKETTKVTLTALIKSGDITVQKEFRVNVK